MTERADGPTILALDFDGVLCEGTREYFETSRRTYRRIWPEAPVPSDDLLPAFQDLRPVIETGWEMPVLVKALVDGVPRARLESTWPAARDELVGGGETARADLVKRLKKTLDGVRREWIAADRADWFAKHGLYCERAEVGRLVARPEQTVIVTTKEGEFAKLLLEHWGIAVHRIQGKEAGSHKCDNLRELIASGEAAGGHRPRLWFVEDRLETLRCVTTHPDLADVGLFLAAWGYTTERARESARRSERIRLLSLEEFRGGVSAWPAAGGRRAGMV